jgi:pimeloyl-ACP methyl ester carboxylesterase
VEEVMPLGQSGIQVRVMKYGEAASGRRPLVILNSIDFPMPPSDQFCDRMRRSGFRVVFIERPGFGTSTPLPDVLLQSETIQKGAASMAEAAILQEVFRRLALEDFVLLGMGSANSVCYRLAMICPMVSLAIFSNAVFNQNILDVFRPNWFQAMLRQTIQSKAGLQIASFGVKYRLRRNPEGFYSQVLQKSAGDLGYLQTNLADFERAAELFQSIEAQTIEYDLNMSLKPDALLKDGLFEATNAVAFSGLETTDHWKSQLNKEAKRLRIDVKYAPNGDLYAPYASPEFLLEVIKDRLKRSGTAQSG